MNEAYNVFASFQHGGRRFDKFITFVRAEDRRCGELLAKDRDFCPARTEDGPESGYRRM